MIIFIKRLQGLPYAIAILSHFLIGDIITGNPTLFYGFSDQTFGNFRTIVISEYGEDYGMLYWAAADAVMLALFALYTVTKKNLPTIFSFPLKHVLILGIVVISIVIGTLKNQILFVTLNQNEIIYVSYSMIVLSQIIFVAIIVRGTARVSVRQLTTADS